MTMPHRPIMFGLGLVCCLAGAITCATVASGDPQTFPSLSDGLIVSGIVMLVLGTAGRKPRGRQMLGRRAPDSPQSE